MRIRTTLSLMGAALVTTTSLLGWQLWSSHQLRQDLSALQQTLSQQPAAPSPNTNQLALNQRPNSSVAPNAAVPNNVVPNPATPRNSPQNPPQSSPVNPPGASADPFDGFFGGSGDPFADFDQLRQQMEQQMQQLMGSMGQAGGPGNQGGSLFDSFGNFGGGAFNGAAQPQISMSEKPDAYVITIDLPKGSSDVEVNTAVENGQLNIEGKLTVKHEDKQQGRNFTSQQTQEFSRSLPLPADADALGIRNETQGDQMIVTVPKLAS